MSKTHAAYGGFNPSRKGSAIASLPFLFLGAAILDHLYMDVHDPRQELHERQSISVVANPEARTLTISGEPQERASYLGSRKDTISIQQKWNFATGETCTVTRENMHDFFWLMPGPDKKYTQCTPIERVPDEDLVNAQKLYKEKPVEMLLFQ